MRKAGGNWVDGDRFFDREAEVEALIERVHEGRHTLLTAQRRMGKTSLVRETLRRLKEGGEVEPLFVDLEDALSPEDVVAEIAAQTLSAQGRWLPIKRAFANFLDQAGRGFEELGFADLKVKLRSGIDSGNWKQRGEAVFAALDDHEIPVVLAIDELPILVNRLLKGQDYQLTAERKLVADEFLGWLRKAAQAHRGLCLIISGSISLEPILRQAGLSAHANVYSPFELKPWTRQLLRTASLHSRRITRSTCPRRYVDTCVVCCAAAFRSTSSSSSTTSMKICGEPADVPLRWKTWIECMRSTCWGFGGTIDLDHYQSRLAMVLGSGSQRIAIELLTEAAVNQGVLSGESIALCQRYFRSSGETDLTPVQDVLLPLEHDGYLAATVDGYGFVSRLVEDWWRVRFGATFVPIGHRKLDAEG